MEFRFRKLVGPRRDKVEAPQAELDLHSIAYQSATTQAPQPIFIHQSLPKSFREARKLEGQGLSLKGLSYDSVPAGKTPVFGSKPQKGNGPVKLQTSRRLSSGDLMTTTQNNERTLNDIREGDYIVGRKESVMGRSVRQSAPRFGPGTPHSNYTTNARPNSSRTAQSGKSSWSCPPTPTSPRNSLKSGGTVLHSSGDMREFGLGLPAITSSQSQHEHYEIKSASSPDLGNKPRSHLGPIEEQNATITALWKAEYSRLVTLYGQDGVDRNMAQLSRRQSRASVKASPRLSGKPLTIVLEPLPQPAHERRSIESKRSSATSGHCSSYRDDMSDASSMQRMSLSSSCAASSSYTTQTSFGDVESPTTREDIRKIVAEMRSTYLRALEAQSQPASKTKSMKKKRRPRLPTSPLTSDNQESEILGVDRQTWHGDAAATDVKSDEPRKPRAISNPGQEFGRLSTASNSSPVETTVPRRELKRADSMTLGGLLGEPKEERRASSRSGRSSHSSTEAVIQNNTQQAEPDNLSTKEVHRHGTTWKRPEKAPVLTIFPTRTEYRSEVRPASTSVHTSLSAYSELQTSKSVGNPPPRPPPALISKMSLVNFI